ncbi:MAG: hypothetical protein H7Y41_01260 [Hyphomonadaceae bacterium]|nr:hypothetical protein [Clostridia bacterium]
MSAVRKERTYDVQTIKPVKRVNTNRVGKIKAAKRQRMMKICSLLFFFAIAFVVVFRFAAIGEMNSKIAHQKKEIASLERGIQQARVQMEYAVDLKKVEEYAKNTLGMQRPEKYQIVRMNLSQGDHAQVMAKKNDGVVKNVLGFLGTAVEYLY